MRTILTSVPFVVVVSTALVALGVVLATAPATRGLWISNAAAAVSLFGAIISTGTAIRHRRNRRN